MKSKKNMPFSNLKFENWKNLINFAFICFYFLFFVSLIVGGARGSDYELYWSTGKIADEKGYSQIYSFSELRNVYQKIVDESGDYASNETLYVNKFPAPYFSLFFVPFQFLSRISVVSGFAIWIFLNLAILIGYLLFFFRRIDSGLSTNVTKLKILIPFLISFPVFFNLLCGQVEVFVLICAGEFIRQAGNNKPFLSGLWLGGLLLKPQLLVLIIPIFIIMRYWKPLAGFFVSSGLIILFSSILSGLSGMRALINLWTKNGNGIPADTLQLMINWRMVGASINNLLNTSFGWAITSLGIGFTILAVCFLTKQLPSYGSSSWVLKMMGVFAATLITTWHSVYHMAMVLIPFLVFALVNNLLPKNKLYLWAITTPVVFFGTWIIVTFFFELTDIDYLSFYLLPIAFTGLISNLFILILTIRYSKNQEMLLGKSLSAMSTTFQ